MSDNVVNVLRRAASMLLVMIPVVIWSARWPAMAQTTSPSKSIGMFAYPKNNQSAEQQATDEKECFSSAKENSVIDPQAPAPAAKSAEQKAAEQKAAADNAPKARGGRARGAARGAAGGAVVGAIADDEAGKGAGAGAASGTMVGGAEQRKG